jgi:hypothetical protein
MERGQAAAAMPGEKLPSGRVGVFSAPDVDHETGSVTLLPGDTGRLLDKPLGLVGRLRSRPEDGTCAKKCWEKRKEEIKRKLRGRARTACSRSMTSRCTWQRVVPTRAFVPQVLDWGIRNQRPDPLVVMIQWSIDVGSRWLQHTTEP